MRKGKAPDTILRLVDNFDRNVAAYRSPAYNEAQVRKEFLDPFFEAMGWDMANRQGFDLRYRQVVHEAALRVGGTTKAPDYSFRIGGVRKFFVEAKKPAHNLKRDIDPALQLRRYAYTARLPLSILSDFDEFCVYDTRIRPGKTDKPATARVRYLEYTEYPDAWEELCATFSPDAIQQGAFDKFVESKGKRGTAQVDVEFLKDIERWRDLLARNIALRNPRLAGRDLNFAVQRTIDRIIFLRICEDRGIERTDSLQVLLNGTRTYRRLFELFYRADERYNSGLFHFTTEKGRDESPDEVTPGLKVDDKVLKEIIGNLYYPDSPYEFSVFPADILGHVYEQFLGKVIRLTAGHRAKVEYKPEVRKAGGVYYTPTYIVDYIVKNTVGKLLDGGDSSARTDAGSLSLGRERARVRVKSGKKLTPAQAAKLRILDPACGSGSFLLGAFQYLLDWHRDWYIAHGPAKCHKQLYKGPAGEWRLTTGEKKRILLNNIYGVDIDSQAVEVTKLSLLLKVLEGESEQSINLQLRMFRERALPDLSSNIRCGNSLIGSDFYEGQQQALFDDEEQRIRINAFDWEDEFPDIMKAGGFDAVIGNPPWGANFRGVEQAYLVRRFETGVGRTLDSYALFLEQALTRLRERGLLGFITPDTFLRKDDHLATRRLLLTRSRIAELIETGPVFARVRDTWCLVGIYERGKPQESDRIRRRRISRFVVSAEERLSRFGRGQWDAESYSTQAMWLGSPHMIVGYLTTDKEQTVIAKMKQSPKLADLKSTYAVSRGEEGSKLALGKHAKGKFSMIVPADVERYSVGPGVRVTASSLTASKVRMIYTHPKLWCIRIQKMRWRQRIVCGLDERTNSAGMKTLQVVVSPADMLDDLKYLQGILASRLINFWCTNFLADDLNQTYLEKLPIAKATKREARKMVKQVERMLKLHKDLPKTKGASKTAIERRIKATDRAIDELVYELYGLTEKEIRTVEEART